MLRETEESLWESWNESIQGKKWNQMPGSEHWGSLQWVPLHHCKMRTYLPWLGISGAHQALLSSLLWICVIRERLNYSALNAWKGQSHSKLHNHLEVDEMGEWVGQMYVLQKSKIKEEKIKNQSPTLCWILGPDSYWEYAKWKPTRKMLIICLRH